MATTTGLNKAQKAKVREGLRKRIRSKFYKKGHAAQKTGKKISAIKTKKGTPKDLDKQLASGEISQKVYDTDLPNLNHVKFYNAKKKPILHLVF